MMIASTSPAKLITKIYTTMHINFPIVCPRACVEWQADLGIQRRCGDSAVLTHMLLLNYRLCLIHVKFLHILYRTPIELNKMKLRESAGCVRCRAPDADFMHLAWGCPGVAKFWSEVFACIEGMTFAATSNRPTRICLQSTCCDNLADWNAAVAG